MLETSVLVIGGGINGAGIFRDLSLHGVPTLLIDRGDFASQTSQSSSKMLHGGIRYLENLDFDLVKEALHEKNHWKKVAPHLTRELPFILPLYNDSKDHPLMIRAGLFLYDLLSSFENSPHQILSKNESLHSIVGLKESGLLLSGLYYDVILDDAKLTLEVIYDALATSNESRAFNHTELIDLHVCEDYHIATLKNRLTGNSFKVKATDVVMAAGPFTDTLMKNLGIPWEQKLLPSKGIHLWIKKSELPLTKALVMRPNDGRIIFVIPHQDAILVGTTETPPDSDFFNQKSQEAEIEYLLKNLADYFPKLKITKNSILASYAGIRPLVKADSGELGKTSRHHKVYRPYHHLHVILGGKLTTFRSMACDISRPLSIKHGHPYSETRSKAPLKIKSHIHHECLSTPTPQELKDIIREELPKTFEDLVMRRLSVPSKKFWKSRFDCDFDQFFLDNKILLQSLAGDLKKDIDSYPAE